MLFKLFKLSESLVWDRAIYFRCYRSRLNSKCTQDIRIEHWRSEGNGNSRQLPFSRMKLRFMIVTSGQLGFLCRAINRPTWKRYLASDECVHTHTYTSCLPAKLDALTRSCETVCRPLFRAVLSSTLLYLYRGRNASVSSPCLEMTCAASTLKPFLTICCASHPSPAGISSSKTRREVKVRLDRVLDTRSKLEKNFVLEIDRS